MSKPTDAQRITAMSNAAEHACATDDATAVSYWLAALAADPLPVYYEKQLDFYRAQRIRDEREITQLTVQRNAAEQELKRLKQKGVD